ncbi:MAG: hypothetical protein V3U65_19735 [Granulosicoccaceae bacterium]
MNYPPTDGTVNVDDAAFTIDLLQGVGTVLTAALDRIEASVVNLISQN